VTSETTAKTVSSTADGRLVVAIAWPTSRPIYAYTVEQIAEGVDVYTRRLKARHRAGERDA
jgi:hypothetical protein